MLAAWAQEEGASHFDSTPSMPSSHMPNAEISILGALMTTLERLELNVALGAKIIEMEEFITMLSLLGRGNTPLGTSGPLTSTVATQILAQAKAHRALASIMRQKKETSSPEDWDGQAETGIQYLNLVQNGMKSSWQRLEMSFLDFARTWILDHCVSISLASGPMQIGGIDWNPLLTPIQQLLSYTQTKCLLLIDGHMTILTTAMEVSYHGGGKAP